MKVFFTVDVEVWVTRWGHDHERFPDAFKQFIYGATPRGDYGVPYQVRLLNEYGLHGAFFVEALSACGFGMNQLSETVGLIRDEGQEVQLHLHPEWVDKFESPIISGCCGDNMHELSLQHQTSLVEIGLRNLANAGAHSVNAHRAGNYGADRNTLRALAANGVKFDTSYNVCHGGLDRGIWDGELRHPAMVEGVCEHPVTVFQDCPGHLRHVQLRSVSYAEIVAAMRDALKKGYESFVIVSHGFEMLDRSLQHPDPIVVSRFNKLCRFLSCNSDIFPTADFRSLTPKSGESVEPLLGGLHRTVGRSLEQVMRRVFH